MVFLLPALAAQCTVVSPATSSEDPPLHPLLRRVPLLGPEAISVLKGAERVEVFRLDQSKFPWGESREFPGFAVLSTGKAQGKKFAARLAALLLDEKTYSAEGKLCEPNPGVAFQLWKGKQHVDMTLCFECNMLQVNSKLAGDFDFVRPALVTLAREAFPDDPEIQKLREHRAPSERVLQFLGRDAASIITEAKRVEVFRLDPSEKPLEPGEPEVSGYRVIATDRAKGKEFADRIAALLLDERNYWFKGPSKLCRPAPTVAFRLWHERKHADVVLCFECTMLQLNPEVYFEDFDPIRPDLVRLAKEAFPRDPVIQKLADASPFPTDSSPLTPPPATDPKSR